VSGGSGAAGAAALLPLPRGDICVIGSEGADSSESSSGERRFSRVDARLGLRSWPTRFLRCAAAKFGGGGIAGGAGGGANMPGDAGMFGAIPRSGDENGELRFDSEREYDMASAMSVASVLGRSMALESGGRGCGAATTWAASPSWCWCSCSYERDSERERFDVAASAGVDGGEGERTRGASRIND